MKHRSTALIIFSDGKGRFLLQDRRNRPYLQRFGEEWGFFGGGIEPGETPQMAVERECMEELNYKLTDYELIGIAEGKTKEWKKMNWVFVGPLPPLEEFRQDEGQGMALFTLEGARKLKMQGPWDSRTLDLLEMYARGEPPPVWKNRTNDAGR